MTKRKMVRILILFLFVWQHVSAQQLKVSCVGNSITYGYGLANPSGQSYPAQMQTLLGTTGWDVENFGSSGRTLLKSGGYSYWDDQLYIDALASNPNYVIIELGTNDSKRWLWDSHGSEFKPDYKAMVQSFQNLSSNPEIWIGLLIPGEKADWDIYNNYIKDKVNPKIKEVALEMGIGLIDLYAEIDSITPELYLPDSVHPSVAGAGIIANKISEMLLMEKPEINYANGKVTAPDGVDYQWYIDGIPVASGNGGRQKEITVTESGEYKVSVKLNSDNETRIISKELDVKLTSVKSYYFNNIKVYPLPAYDVIHVQSDNVETNTAYMITDLSGRPVLMGQLLNGCGEITIERLSTGTYFLAVNNEHVKLIKRE